MFSEKPDNLPPDPLLEKFNKRIKRAKAARKDRLKDIQQARKYYRGDFPKSDGDMRVNLVYSTLASIIPNIYAKNPEFSVGPNEAVSQDHYALYSGFGKTMEAVLKRTLTKEARLKAKAKAALRSTMATGIGWAKVQYQKDYGKDPIIQSRLQDVQDNLAALERTMREAEEGSGEEAEAARRELEIQMQAMQDSQEIVVAEGLVIDRVPNESILLLDDSLIDFTDYPQSDAIAQEVWMTCQRFEELFKCKVPDGATKYSSKTDDGANQSKGGESPELLRLYEVWELNSSTIYTIVEGAKTWAREPYQPEFRTRRFYPFHALAYNIVDGYFEPFSDVELLLDLQDEYNAMRSQQIAARKENRPVWLYRLNGSLTEQDMNNIANRGDQQFIGVQGNQSVPLSNDLAHFPPSPMNPMVYDPSQTLRDVEMLTGAGDASRGFVNKAKTATEAEIMSMGIQSRSSERLDAMEDWLADIANDAAQLLLQAMPEEHVRRIAGQEAVWPTLPRPEIFEMLNLEIRAGSTAKPDKNKEREQWLQMLPEIKQTVQLIAQYQAQGQTSMADVTQKLMEETLRRFDERIDVSEFVPQVMPMQQMEMALPPTDQQEVTP